MAEPITLEWLRGPREAILRIREVEALDDLTEDGAQDFRYRLSLGAPRGSLSYAPVTVKEMKHCIRLGLIGAGASREDAAKDADRAFDEEDSGALALACFTLISNALMGKAHDPVGEMKGGAERQPASASPESTEQAQPSASPRRKSGK